MAQLDKFKKSFDIVKNFLTNNHQPKSSDKVLIPVKYLRHETVIDKKDCLKHCDILGNIICSNNFRNHADFKKYLIQLFDLLFHLSNNDDVDIRNVVNETCDKLISNLIESHSNHLLVEFCVGIVKPLSQRSLKLSLAKFSDICHRIRVHKFHAFAKNLYVSFVNLILDTKNELLQETLYHSICKIYPILTSYATEKTIIDILNAYLSNLSSPSNAIRRYSALSIVILCDSTWKPEYYFNLTLNLILNLMSSKPDNKDLLYSGIFIFVKNSFSKIAAYIDKNDHSKTVDSTLKSLSFIYQEMISTIKSATSNILIISTLEAIVEFFNTMPWKILSKFSDYENMEFECLNSPSFSIKIPNPKDTDSMINIENINDELCEETFENAGIVFNNVDLTDNASEVCESEFDIFETSESNFDQESEIGSKSVENKAFEFDVKSETSHNTSNKCPMSPFDSSFDLITDNFNNSVNFDEFNLNELFSYEHIVKLICIKYLLKGQPGQLIPDSEVRVSIKSLSLTCLSSIVQVYPQILFEKITYKNNVQHILDILLYLNHTDPNIRGHVALIIGKYLKKTLSYSFSYEEFLIQNNCSNNEEIFLNNLIIILKNLILDSSSITVKHVLNSFQQFLPELFLYNETNSIAILFDLIENLFQLRNNSYWLIKVELLNLFSTIPFNHLKHFENQIKLSNYFNNKNTGHYIPMSKRILEEIVFNFLFDNDHRVRQASLNLIPNFIENLYLNNYILHNDSINLIVLESMLAEYSLNTKPNFFDKQFPSIDVFEYPLNMDFQLYQDDYNHLKNFIIESNIMYFVKKFLYELRKNFHSKLLLKISLNCLSNLSKLYPPLKYTNAWMINSSDSIQDGQNCVEFIQFLIDLLCKNPIILNDLTIQQNLIDLIMNLIEAVFASCFNIVQKYQKEFQIESSNDLHRIISPNLAKCIEMYFIFLYKIIVIFSSLTEDNYFIFTSFIDHIYTKNVSISVLMKKHSSNFFDMKEKNIWNKKDPKKREAFDSASFKLFETLKNYRNRKSQYVRDKSSYLNSVLHCFSKILEYTSASFLINYLEDILIYLKMIFYLNPSAVVRITNKLSKCIFEINYISTFIEVFNHEEIKKPLSNQKDSFDFKSFHNICFVLPYTKFNDNFNYTKLERVTNPKENLYSCLGFIRKWTEYKHIKIMNSDMRTLDNNGSSGNNVCLKKFLTNKIKYFDVLVVESMKHYMITSDTKFQSNVLDLLIQLMQFHVSFSMIDPENYLITYIMKQFDYLENVHNEKSFQPLMKYVFYFFSTLYTQSISVNTSKIQPVDIPKMIQLCDNLIAIGHQDLAIDGLYIIIDYLFYSDFNITTTMISPNVQTKDELKFALETEREVILAYCFKLISHNKTFHLFSLILNYYKFNDEVKWKNLSIQIIETLLQRLSGNIIKIDTIDYFKSLHLLMHSINSEAFILIYNNIESLFKELNSSTCNSTLLFKYLLPKLLFYLKLIFANLNETDLLFNVERIKNSINIINLNPINAADCLEKINADDIFVYFLLTFLQKILIEIDNDLLNGIYNGDGHRMIVYLLRYYQLLLAFIFQSGFYPRLTNSAITLIKQPKADISLNNEFFDVKIVNDIFLKLGKFYPVISLSWLNFLYLLNYDKLPKILSKCIEKRKILNNAGVEKNFVQLPQISTVNFEIIKRSSLILLCDYLSENLENVEFVSWFIIHHLKDIIEHCHEMPIKEFINAIHRKPVSSGLLLQVISSRSDELLTNSITANKILYCLERSHSRQNIALIMFLLEKYLCNPKFTIYYKCCKYAESIITSRLISIYDGNDKSLPLFNYEDFNNLLKILKHTSYSKLYLTVKMIRMRHYDLQQQKHGQTKTINDPLSEKRIIVPEIDKNWLICLIEKELSQQQKININGLNLLDKLSNDDIIKLIFSENFSITNLLFILKLIVDKHDEQLNRMKNSSPIGSFNRIELAKLIMPIYFQFMMIILDKFPLKHYFLERKLLLINDLEPVFTNEYFLNLILMFNSSFSFFVKHYSLLQNYKDEEKDKNVDSFLSATIQMTTIYSTLIYLFQNEKNYQQLINLMKIIEHSLNDSIIYNSISNKENVHLQLTLINAIHFTFKHHYHLEQFILPATLQNDMDTSLSDYKKLISMFCSLEKQCESIDINELEIPLFSIVLKKIVLKLCRLPLFISFIYIPYNLIINRNEQIFNGLTSVANIPIVTPQYLSEIDTFKQFMFRIANLGFVHRHQFEEIWMTLLGVLSDCFCLITQNRPLEALNDCLIMSKLVIIAITNLLYNAHTNSIIDNGSKKINPSLSSSSSSTSTIFGPKFELIRGITKRTFKAFDDASKVYNEPILNNSYSYQFKSINECLLELKNSENRMSQSSPNDIDLYSCIQFILDFYLQQIKLFTKTIYFPIVTEISKSTLIISELIVDTNQYKKFDEIFNELSKIVIRYDDEILNQFVSVGLCKSYLLLPDKNINSIELQKEIIVERNFKEFYLPSRIYAIQAIEYLIEGHFIENKDINSLLDYIVKHLNSEHVLPSSYCKEYLEKLINIAFVLMDSYTEMINSDYNEKLMKGLLKLTSKNSNIQISKALNQCFEKLIYNRKLSTNDAISLRNIVLKKINITTNPLYTIHMLNLIVCTTYFVGSINFDLESEDDNDELFKIMEKLSIIFEPLKWCNSLEANVICQVLGHFLAEFFPTQDILNKCIGEFLSKQQNHYKYLIDILYIIYSKLQVDCCQNVMAQDWVILSLSSFTQLVPISHSLWALTCFLICASQNHWIRSSYYYFQKQFGKFTEQDKQAFFYICNNFYNEIKSDANKMSFIKTLQKAACVPNSPYIEVLQYLCDI